MKSLSWKLILIPILAIIIYVSLPSNPSTSIKQLGDSTAWMQWKKMKDESLKNNQDSPILNKEEFNGLSYFPYNPEYVIEFKLLKAKKSSRIQLQMTDGSLEELSYFGDIESKIKGQAIRLKLYQHDNGELFLPFKDKTAPQETYGGGRYMDIPISNSHDSGILIDFNYAYHPYCAYNKNYACPIPPKENQVSIRIEAGEKITQSF